MVVETVVPVVVVVVWGLDVVTVVLLEESGLVVVTVLALVEDVVSGLVVVTVVPDVLVVDSERRSNPIRSPLQTTHVLLQFKS